MILTSKKSILVLLIGFVIFSNAFKFAKIPYPWEKDTACNNFDN